MKTALLCLLKLRFLGDEYLTHPVPDRFFLIENDICLFLKYFTRTWFLTSYLRYSIGFTPTLVLLDKQTTFSLTPQSVYLTKFLPVCNLNILACRYLILVCQHVDLFFVFAICKEYPKESWRTLFRIAMCRFSFSYKLF